MWNDAKIYIGRNTANITQATICLFIFAFTPAKLRIYKISALKCDEKIKNHCYKDLMIRHFLDDGHLA